MRLHRIDRQRIEQENFLNRVYHIYSKARIFYYTSEQLRQELADTVWHATDYRRLTQAKRAYIQGYVRALDAALWNDVVWRLGPTDGPLSEQAQDTEWASTSNPDGGVLSVLAREKGKLFGGHFWKGTDKPFTAYHVMNE